MDRNDAGMSQLRNSSSFFQKSPCLFFRQDFGPWHLDGDSTFEIGIEPLPNLSVAPLANQRIQPIPTECWRKRGNFVWFRFITR